MYFFLNLNAFSDGSGYKNNDNSTNYEYDDDNSSGADNNSTYADDDNDDDGNSSTTTPPTVCDTIGSSSSTDGGELPDTGDSTSTSGSPETSKFTYTSQTSETYSPASGQNTTWNSPETSGSPEYKHHSTSAGTAHNGGGDGDKYRKSTEAVPTSLTSKSSTASKTGLILFQFTQSRWDNCTSQCVRRAKT